ncbi:carbohydrate porin [Gaetbulibacter saemankumensis]|uniref:carbohydrate porin n=1 Tax=Gaetbulibacter saemankumensis TaxID=311208 RepID=UPI000688F65C|nr:carbohydrate porin [Gaetbulibacter saemankumensis]
MQLSINNSLKTIMVSFVLVSISLTLHSQTKENREQDSIKKFSEITNPASVHAQVRADRETFKSEHGKTNLLKNIDAKNASFTKKTGFTIGGDYNSAIHGGTNTIGDEFAASGVARLYGHWYFAGRNNPNNEGGIVFKIENRHAYTDLPIQIWGALGVGYAGTTLPVYGDDGWYQTNLYWRQSFMKGRLVFYAGYTDMKDWTDLYALISPWQGFQNLIFATGSGTTGAGYPDGSLGMMVSAFLTDDIYVVASFNDINRTNDNVFRATGDFFKKFETIKIVEVGYLPGGKKSIFSRNFHVTFWQVDESSISGTPNGWGVSGSLSWKLDNNWMPFLRGGWSEDGGALYSASASAGVGYFFPNKDVLGIGLNWNQPSASTLAPGLRDQYVFETYYKWMPAAHIELTPDVQLIGNPSLNPDADLVLVGALRLRMFI